MQGAFVCLYLQVIPAQTITSSQLCIHVRTWVLTCDAGGLDLAGQEGETSALYRSASPGGLPQVPAPNLRKAFMHVLPACLQDVQLLVMRYRPRA